MISKVKDCWNNREKIRKHLNNRIPEVKQLAITLWQLKSIVDKNEKEQYFRSWKIWMYRLFCLWTICLTNASLYWKHKGISSTYCDLDKCLHCGLCQTVCYKYFDTSLIKHDSYAESEIYGVINNYVKQLSEVSTLGIATVIADTYFRQNKNVVGVDFDPITNNCYHKIAKSLEDIKSFTGSKYLQSCNYDAFKDALNTDKETVVFGTPCQIYGLQQVIKKKKNEDRFLLVDLLRCVPSKNLWLSYKNI